MGVVVKENLNKSRSRIGRLWVVAENPNAL